MYYFSFILLWFANSFSLWVRPRTYQVITLRQSYTWEHYLIVAKTSKPNSFKVPKANANSLFLTTNVQKLRFYKNKGLSTDRHYGVPNTFPTRNQTSEFKNHDFLPVHIRLGKMTFFLA